MTSTLATTAFLILASTAEPALSPQCETALSRVVAIMIDHGRESGTLPPENEPKVRQGMREHFATTQTVETCTTLNALDDAILAETIKFQIESQR